MRLDYTLYILAVLFFLITAVSSIILVETERSLWVVTTVVLGILSVGLGYYQRPKAKAEACQPAVPISQPTMPQTQPAPPVEAPREEKTEAPTAEPPLMETPPVTQTATLVSRKMRLTRIKGIGEKRVAQLNSLGINNIKELAEASAEDIAKNLQISPKITQKWIAAAKELVK
ncbi:helix-hairpin-helix domain-containing protein [Candidatus Bathyarchaeota archaeon]|nr:helix-hairpin-helix domain-containing protein [Candidatus Bathyarchaeota archaeon]